MSMVSLTDVTKSYDGQLVLDAVEMTINPGERIGLVGPNGTGKTTIFRLIVGQIEPDSGRIERNRRTRIGYLPQEPDLDTDRSVFDETMSVFEQVYALERKLHELSDRISHEHAAAHGSELMRQYDRLQTEFDAAGGYSCEARAKEVLGGLGFADADFSKPTGVLSGGQKCRVALAKLLLDQADLLLLDEPTNHLDMDATDWLEGYLNSHGGGLVIISHDRYLLDRLVTKIIDLDNHTLTAYPCRYSDYADAKRIRRLDAGRAYERQQVWIKHQREYIDRVKFAKDSAKQARARKKMLDRMERRGEILDAPDAKVAPVRMTFKSQDRGGEMVFRSDHVRKAYGQLVVVDDLSIDIQRGQKVGIIGPNGVGKTTLLKMAMGEVAPDAGTLRLYENLSVGYYDQEHEELDPELRALHQAWSVRPEMNELQVRSFLALFGLRGDEVFKRTGDLSGGQQSRVLLARLVWSEPQVLILDEPTNHLDIPTREVLEEALAGYPGTVIMVSHDRYFLDKVITELLVMEHGGKGHLYPGNYSEHVRRKREAQAKAAAEADAVAKAQRAAARRNQPKGKPKPSATSTSPLQKMKLHDLEQAIIDREEEIAHVEADFTREEVYRDPDKVKALRVRHDQLKAELDELNTAWLERADG